MNKKRICVVGLGYVGSAFSILLAKKYDVIALDIDKNKVKKVNSRLAPINDIYIQSKIESKKLNITATHSPEKAFIDANLIILCLPTDFSKSKNSFDTTIISSTLKSISRINKTANVVIKSTLPIGFTESVDSVFQNNIIYSPEFLREGTPLQDLENPDRAVFGGEKKICNEFAQLIEPCIPKKRYKKIFMSSSEAEATKLFANSYLAMRVAFFNELDSLSITNMLSAKNVIDGVCSDKRIGDHYNNPSFGYGGYCLPKDTLQLMVDFKGTDQSLIKSIVDSNKSRKNFIAKKILDKKPKSIGIFRLQMKNGSNNFRESATMDVLQRLSENTNQLFIFEPLITKKNFNGFKVIKDINEFKSKCSLIVANRLDPMLQDASHKVFSRDIFNKN